MRSKSIRVPSVPGEKSRNPLKIRQHLAFAALPAILLGCLLGTAEAEPGMVNARSAILINFSTNQILFEQNADELIPPASVTKILTLYLVFEAIESGRISLGDKVLISKKAAQTGGSSMHLKAGTRVTVDQLIKGTAVVSGNDAAVALAEHVWGSVDHFVAKMNQKARALGMTNTWFETPNGLPAKGQFTTARDMAKLGMAYLRRFPNSLSIHSMQSYTYKGRTQPNRNRLLGTCPGVDGIKTGFVRAAGYNLVATARRGNTRLLAVVLGARQATIRNAETAKLLETGFQDIVRMVQAPSPVETGFQYTDRKTDIASGYGRKPEAVGSDFRYTNRKIDVASGYGKKPEAVGSDFRYTNRKTDVASGYGKRTETPTSGFQYTNRTTQIAKFSETRFQQKRKSSCTIHPLVEIYEGRDGSLNIRNSARRN